LPAPETAPSGEIGRRFLQAIGILPALNIHNTNPDLCRYENCFLVLMKSSHTSNGLVCLGQIKNVLVFMHYMVVFNGERIVTILPEA